MQKRRSWVTVQDGRAVKYVSKIDASIVDHFDDHVSHYDNIGNVTNRQESMRVRNAETENPHPMWM